MATKTTIKLTELEQVISKIPKKKVKVSWESDYGATVDYDEYILPSDVMSHVKRFIEKQTKKL
jgi:uncharacterized protein (UPF0332 family)